MFQFLLVFVNVLKCVAVGSVCKGPLKKCFQFISLQTQLRHNASPYEVKPNTRQQLLVKHLEDGRLWYIVANKMRLCEISVGFSAPVFSLEKTKGKVYFTQYYYNDYTETVKHLSKQKFDIVRYYCGEPLRDIIV